MKSLCFFFVCFILASCDYLGVIMETKTPEEADAVFEHLNDTTLHDSLPILDTTLQLPSSGMPDTPQTEIPATEHVDTKNVHPEQLVAFATTLYGTPYKYASSNPAEGFDCSGFITYIFNHFHIGVPRSSADFKYVGTEVAINQAKQGDLILFTGTETDTSFARHTIGHMGVITDVGMPLRFIHSSSGKAKGVTITPLNAYYKKRFVKVIRVFK